LAPRAVSPANMSKNGSSQVVKKKRSKSTEGQRARICKHTRPSIINPVIDDPEFTGRAVNKFLLNTLVGPRQSS